MLHCKTLPQIWMQWGFMPPKKTQSDPKQLSALLHVTRWVWQVPAAAIYTTEPDLTAEMTLAIAEHYYCTFTLIAHEGKPQKELAHSQDFAFTHVAIAPPGEIRSTTILAPVNLLLIKTDEHLQWHVLHLKMNISYYLFWKGPLFLNLAGKDKMYHVSSFTYRANHIHTAPPR